MYKQQSATYDKPFAIADDISLTTESGFSVFSHLSFSFHHKKTGLIGKNGIGKTTLLRLIAGEIKPSEGTIRTQGIGGYLPQVFTSSLHKTISQVLEIDEVLHAINQVTKGDNSDHLKDVIGNKWGVERQVQNVLSGLGCDEFKLDRQFETLSGGERMKILLTKLLINHPDFMLMDEPTRNLDAQSRKGIYSHIKEWDKGILVVSHDRELLNLMERIVVLDEHGIHEYGGNYDFYESQRHVELQAAIDKVDSTHAILKSSKHQFQQVREQQEKRISHAKKYGADRRIPKIIVGAMKRKGQETTAKLRSSHQEIIDKATKDYEKAKEGILSQNNIRINLSSTTVPNGKLIVDLKEVSFGYTDENPHVIDNFSFSLYGPERVSIAGPNGSGKSTLVKLIMGEVAPDEGEVVKGTDRIAYLDQHAHGLDQNLTVIQNLEKNATSQTPLLLRQYLGRFLFHNDDIYKKIGDLSGGEGVRATLATILLGDDPPQLLILDEPTNNLDLNSVEQIESALSNYKGALIVISHDNTFLENIGVSRVISLGKS